MTRNPITYHVPSTVGEVIKILIKNNITGLPLVDQSGSIGRRYARQDEIGTPYCITFDSQTPLNTLQKCLSKLNRENVNP